MEISYSILKYLPFEEREQLHNSSSNNNNNNSNSKIRTGTFFYAERERFFSAAKGITPFVEEQKGTREERQTERKRQRKNKTLNKKDRDALYFDRPRAPFKYKFPFPPCGKFFK